MIQFPWRLLSVQAFFGALLAGLAAEHLPRPWWVAVLGVLLLLVSAVGNLSPEYIPLHDQEVTPDRLALFELFTTNIGTTIRGEYLPVGVDPRPLSSAMWVQGEQNPPPVAIEGEISAELLRRDARSQEWRIVVTSDAGQDSGRDSARVAFDTLYFAGWAGNSDGEALDLEPLPGSGLIAADLPAGEHRVILRFRPTPARVAGNVLSLAGFVLLALTWGISLRGVRVNGGKVGILAGSAMLCAAAILAVGALPSRPVATENTALSMDFDRMPFLHDNPEGIDFRVARLLSYDLRYGTGGDSFDVRLHWSSEERDQTADLRVDVRLVTPADAHPDLAPSPQPLARVSEPLSGPSQSLVLHVPEDAASGVYYIALRVFEAGREHRAVNARGEMLGTVYLEPVWVDNPQPASPDDPILARFGDRILLRDDVKVQAGEGFWDVRLAWQATRPVPINYTCSLHLLSMDGDSLAQRDWAEGPGYGFWPTSAWPVGEWLTDRLRVPIPLGTRAEDAAALRIVLYDRSQPGTPALGQTVVPLIERERNGVLPAMEVSLDVRFGPIALRGYDLEQTGEALHLTLHWQALRDPSIDGVVFVHLYDPSDERIVSQSDARPVHGTYPTSWWRQGEVISESIVLSLSGVPAGTYRIGLGMYVAGTPNRLPLTVGGVPDSSGRLVLEKQIELP
jgi:hypothetical protein